VYGKFGSVGIFMDDSKTRFSHELLEFSFDAASFLRSTLAPAIVRQERARAEGTGPLG